MKKRAFVCTLVALLMTVGSVAAAQSADGRSGKAFSGKTKHSLWSLLSAKRTVSAKKVADLDAKLAAGTVDLTTEISGAAVALGKSIGEQSNRPRLLGPIVLDRLRPYQIGGLGSGRPFASPTRPWAGPLPP